MVLRNLGSAFSRLSLLPSISRGVSMVTRGVERATLGTTQRAACLTTICLRSDSKGHSGMTSSCILASPALTPTPSPSTLTPTLTSLVRHLSTCEVQYATLLEMHLKGPFVKKSKNKNPLGDRPFSRGVILKTLIKKPKKPNSANRKCVLVRLSTGREMVAYVPGEGHNLQEHNIVLVRPGRLQDVPGVKLVCVRGKYDLQHVIKKKPNP